MVDELTIRVCQQSQGLKNAGQRWPEAHQKACDKSPIGVGLAQISIHKKEQIRTRIRKW